MEKKEPPVVKPMFDPTVNLGHVLILVGLLAPAIVFGFGFASDFRETKREVQRQREDITDLKHITAMIVESKGDIAKTLEGVRVMLGMHLGVVPQHPPNGTTTTTTTKQP